MGDSDTISALKAENETLKDMIAEQNETVSELRQQIALLEYEIDGFKTVSLSAIQVRF